MSCERNGKGGSGGSLREKKEILSFIVTDNSSLKKEKKKRRVRICTSNWFLMLNLPSWSYRGEMNNAVERQLIYFMFSGDQLQLN